MRHIAKALLALSLVALGMAGLYFKIEYSGWVLAAGLAVALG
jgi:hypothetical protein